MEKNLRWARVLVEPKNSPISLCRLLDITPGFGALDHLPPRKLDFSQRTLLLLYTEHTIH
jgi:hypothetical protein